MIKPFRKIGVNFLILVLSFFVIGCKHKKPNNIKELRTPPPSISVINDSLAIKDLERYIRAGQRGDGIEIYHTIIELPSIPFLRGRYFQINDPLVVPSPTIYCSFYQGKINILNEKSLNFRDVLKYDDKLTKKNVDLLVGFILEQLGHYRVVNDVLEIPGVRDRYFEGSLIIKPLSFMEIKDRKYISCYSWSPFTREVYKLDLELYPDSANIVFLKVYKDKVGWEGTLKK